MSLRSTVTAWSMQVALSTRTSVLNLVGLDSRGRPLGGATDTITIEYTGAVPPSPAGQVVLHEIMYHPIQPGASFVALFNVSLTATLDLTGWRLSGVDFDFPPGTLLGPRA